ncbi:MAG: acyl-ACP--UDP-N-acetylglucosamine O-acyltransferase [Gammaproteobacteria bacterium]|nr:acyl-ACP--UDP-N-acetylglucosamine O-acyltransferase [Gammaproteobacteria bacterium]
MNDNNLIHPSAVISAEAILAEDVKVGPYAVIGPSVQIGAGSEIGSHCVIKGPTVMGANNRIYPFASIGDDPQDKKYGGEETHLEIGEGNTIREYCTINRGTQDDEGITRVGDDNWLMAYSHIAHDCQLGSHIVMVNGSSLAGHVHVDDYVILSAFTAIHQFCRIGAHSLIGAYGGVGQDVPPYILVFGQPPTPRGINTEGLKRRDFSAEQIRNLKSAYRLLYRKGLSIAAAREQIAELASEQPELRIIVEFIDRSERGIFR